MQDQLIFGVGRLLCALPLVDVVETIRPLPVQPLAGAEGLILGLAVIRGEAVPVLDTARLLGAPVGEPSRFVTTATARGTVAFAAGHVVGVRAAEPDHSKTLPGTGSLVTGVGVLDGQPLLFIRSDGGLNGNFPPIAQSAAVAPPATTAPPAGSTPRPDALDRGGDRAHA